MGEDLRKYFGDVDEEVQRLLDEYDEGIVVSFIGYALMVLTPFLVMINLEIIPSSAPVLASVASSVGTVVLDKLTGNRFKKTIEFMRLVCEKTSAFEDQVIDEIRNKIGREEAEIVIVRILRSISEKERREKWEFFRNLLLNYLTSGEDEIDRVEIYLNQLDSLSYLEMLLLAFLYRNCNENGHMNDAIVEKTKKFKASQELSNKDLNLAYNELHNNSYFLTGAFNTQLKNDFASLTGGICLSEKALEFSEFVATTKIVDE